MLRNTCLTGLLLVLAGCGGGPTGADGGVCNAGSAGASWTLSPSNPLIRYDPALLDCVPGDPSVLRDGSGYLMYYGAAKGDFSDPNTVRIFRATSANGVQWTRNSSPVLSPGLPGSWDSVKVETPSAIKLPDGSFRLYYAGSDLPNSEANFQLGLATSPDGQVWTRHPSNPVLRLGPVGSLDQISVFEPSVLYDTVTGRYSLWYGGISASLHTEIGLATSTDGVTWAKQGVVMALDVERQSAGDPGLLEEHAIWNGQEYEMVYALLRESRGLGPIWHARSPDGRAWQKDASPILGLGPAGSWYADEVSSPSLLLENGVYRMWFVGSHTDRETFFDNGIGLAEKRCAP